MSMLLNLAEATGNIGMIGTGIGVGLVVLGAGLGIGRIGGALGTFVAGLLLTAGWTPAQLFYASGVPMLIGAIAIWLMSQFYAQTAAPAPAATRFELFWNGEIPNCHDPEGGHPGVRMIKLDSRFHGNDTGKFFDSNQTRT